MTRSLAIAVLLLSGIAFVVFADKPATSPKKKPSGATITVGGEVLSPGRKLWTNGMTAADAIQHAGGFSMTADRACVAIIHHLPSSAVTQYVDFNATAIRSNAIPTLAAGDTVLVARSRIRDLAEQVKTRVGLKANLPPPGFSEQFVYVEGEVRKPGRIVWTNGLRLSQVIALSGGFTTAADITRVRVRHYNLGVDPANYVEATNSPLHDSIMVRGDRILVPAGRVY